jgi:predicted lipoprotein
MKKFSLYLLATVLLALHACQGGEKPPAEAFDRRAMLEHYADNLIVPAYEQLQTRTAALHTAVQQLAQTPAAGTLQAAQLAWEQAFDAWQEANAFNFGPAGESGLRKSLAEEIGTFPANAALIDQYGAAGDTSFANFNRDTRGLLALDYLLFAGSDADVLARFAGTPYGAYAVGVARHLDVQVDAVVAAWQGGYRAQFIGNDGADAGSSTSALYNEFVRSYEVLKNFKVGLPLGKRIGQTAAEPEKVEAFYSGQSLPALRTHFQSLVRIWQGRGLNGETGPGFRDYLASVEGGADLIAGTEGSIGTILPIIDGLVQQNTALAELIAANSAPVNELYNLLSQHTRFWKSDMSSLLGISITYADGDGD